jgi:FkbM family methyltransferase
MNYKTLVRKFKSKGSQLIFFKKNVIPDKKESMDDILNKYKDSFEQSGYDLSIQNNLINITGNGLQIFGESANTFWTAQDVLCKGDYDFTSKNDFVMIDVGLNIGITTLSMARYPNIIKIYGYEPFVPTFKMALRNVNANPILNNKIEIFCFGLGDKNQVLKMNYNPDLPGAMSSVKNNFEKCEQVEIIQIKKASEVISEILQKHKEKIFLKIDCEGAEYEIIEGKTGLLRKIAILVMEWHFKNPVDLVEIMSNNGFVVFNKEIIKNELGFIRGANVSF